MLNRESFDQAEVLPERADTRAQAAAQPRFAKPLHRAACGLNQAIGHTEQGAFPRAAGPHQGNALSSFEAEAEATEPRAFTPWDRDIPQLQHQRILPSDRPTASMLA